MPMLPSLTVKASNLRRNPAGNRMMAACPCSFRRTGLAASMQLQLRAVLAHRRPMVQWRAASPDAAKA